MSRQIAAAALAAIICVACGRSQDTRNTSDQTDASAQNGPVGQIRLIGCLQPFEQAVGTTGTTASATDTKYMLTHAQYQAAQPQSSNSTTGAPVAMRNPVRTEGTQGGSQIGTSSTAKADASATTRDSARTQGTQGGSQMASTYRLDSNDSTLSPEVGHKVEIVAMVEESGSIGRETTETKGAGSSNSASSMPKVKVQSIRMIATNCPSE